ncbi:uncharacterized protein Z519_04702 [Cladophialophora bantiana CBS 173.52]|uniref:Ubiquitin-like domain-containing protein n=1 Tax=Cladophialophora bantiana (strain ATCC 10958 / CBS 173.52 / CDC B-1940 / NIH 8579) TaxID=1442370 RepID=A0A0D2HV25_CLAB1|nr:uncharacterized protein Z519_04702 [Cladophialophora bantiana CBS 173.52]KIW94725.1 hypothetical protein Z519_04702 [Cladophialophora bantiana CBS 173.52]
MVSGVERSLFTKSAWAAPAASNSAFTANSGSIFGRNVNYEDIIRAEKAERERKAAKAKARHEKQKSEGPETKRRRRSAEEHDKERSSESEVEAKKQNRGKIRERPVTRSTPTKEKFLSDGLDASPSTYRSPRRKAAAKSTVISLDDDDDDDGLIMLTPKKPVKASPKRPKGAEVLDGKESEEEDEYLRALKKKAREKARLQRQGGGQTEKRPSTPSARASSTTLENADPRSPSVVHSQHDSRPTSSRSIPDSSASARHTPISEQEDDPEVKILIQSEIPGAKSLIVKRKASQSLKQVKEFWCRKFDLEESVARQVFFTWKGTRLFDSTTMRGIIRGLKKDHHRQQQRPRSLSLSIDDEDGDDGYSSSNAKDPSGGNIMLEATTPEIYEQKLREKERCRQRQQPPQATTSSTDSGQEDQDEEGDEKDQEEDTTHAARAATRSASETTVATNQRDQGAIVIRLVSRDLEPMQLRVRPHTTMDKIMRGYAATRKVDEGKTPWLIFDGDRLDRESTVEDVGLEDDDEVEVSIR